MDETEEGAGRAPSSRLLRSVQTLAQWYRSPDQELMRRELVWTLGWLKSPLGLSLLFANALWPFLIWIISSRNLGLIASRSPIGSYWIFYFSGLVIAFSQFLLSYGPWVYLYQLRAVAPLRTGRLHDLLLSDLKAESLWPGLFAAPVAVLACFTILRLGTSTLIGVYGLFFTENFGGLLLTFFTPVFYALYSLLRLAQGLVFALAINAFVSCFAVPKGGVIRIVVFLIICRLLFAAPPRILSVILPLFPRISIPEQWYWIITIVVQCCSLAIVILFFLACMKWLHSKRFWERLRDHGEAI